MPITLFRGTSLDSVRIVDRLSQPLWGLSTGDFFDDATAHNDLVDALADDLAAQSEAVATAHAAAVSDLDVSTLLAAVADAAADVDAGDMLDRATALWTARAALADAAPAAVTAASPYYQQARDDRDAVAARHADYLRVLRAFIAAVANPRS
jgi:lysophospholipase L1-like esterase